MRSALLVPWLLTLVSAAKRLCLARRTALRATQAARAAHREGGAPPIDRGLAAL